MRQALIAAALLISTPALAACPDDAAIDAFLADWEARAPAAALAAEGSMDDALCAQAKIVARLSGALGPVAGYKAGLTSKPAQERFGVPEPVRGMLLRGMLLEDGATVPATWGARPVFEADLIAVVADEAINAATTPAGVLAHLSAIRPFIELPDLAYAKDQPLTGATITAMNVGARLGVLGAPIPATPALLEPLAAMTVRITDQTGAELSAAPGAAVLGHPLNSVIWLVSNRVPLKAGDLVSVGSFGPLLPPKPGMTVTATYAGLPGDPSVSVSFE
jgi:2-oxo-hept-3-ene-1,7-dioate hydratase